MMNTVNNTTQQPTDTRKYSIYYQELSKKAKRRYNEKLGMLHLKAILTRFLVKSGPLILAFGLKLNILIFTTI